MLKKIWIFVFVGLVFCGDAGAQLSSGVQAFQQNENAWRRSASSSSSSFDTILPNFSRQLSSAAQKNILDSELVFCYNVGSLSRNYNGYTLDGYAITGFCGIIQDELKNFLMTQLFSTPENVDFNSVANCTVSPRIMLRFIRGVDSTDVLLSYPCSALAVFYGGKAEIFNFAPSAQLMEAIAQSFDETSTSFSSPAALKQVIPVGLTSRSVPSSNARRGASNPSALFNRSAPASNSSSQGGWNNLR